MVAGLLGLHTPPNFNIPATIAPMRVMYRVSLFGAVALTCGPLADRARKLATAFGSNLEPIAILGVVGESG